MLEKTMKEEKEDEKEEWVLDQSERKIIEREREREREKERENGYIACACMRLHRHQQPTNTTLVFCPSTRGDG